MAQVSADETTEYEIRQDTLGFIEINGHAQPLEGVDDLVQMYLMSVQHQVYSFEQVPVTDGFAFFKQKIGSLPEEHRAEYSRLDWSW